MNGKEVDELTMLIHVSRAREISARVCEKLQKNIPRQSFLIVIQAAVGKKIINREEIKPFRKDVTAKCVSFTHIFFFFEHLKLPCNTCRSVSPKYRTKLGLSR